MPIEIREVKTQEVVGCNAINKYYAEVFLPNPEGKALEQVLTLQESIEPELYQAITMNMRTHESRMCVLRASDKLVVYPWGTQ